MGTAQVKAKMSEKCFTLSISLARMKSSLYITALDGAAPLPTFPEGLRERNQPLLPSPLRCDLIWQRGEGAASRSRVGVGRGFLPFPLWFKATFVWHSQRLVCGCCFFQACEERKNG